MSEVGSSYWKSHLELVPHPEGGYFKEVYRSQESIPHDALPKRFGGARSFCTSIYYLLEAGDFSAFHRIHSDELWHFYAGGALDLHVLHNERHELVKIGGDVDCGEHLQWVVPAGAWFASCPANGSTYSLVGCTVSPGFEFTDFEMATRRELIGQFPAHREIIAQFTRD